MMPEPDIPEVDGAPVLRARKVPSTALCVRDPLSSSLDNDGEDKEPLQSLTCGSVGVSPWAQGLMAAIGNTFGKTLSGTFSAIV
jgi:hypothetical protein